MKQLLIFLTIKAIILGFVIGGGPIGLAPDEAQYWTWSQDLDWGYYSKPPGIAWQIGLTTSLFGNNPFGVRFGALLIAFILSLVLYRATGAAGLSKQTAYWAAIAMAVSPLGVYLSLVATTDGGAILFLTCAILVLIQGVREERGPNYWLAGLLIGIGALFKWTAFILWPLVLIDLLFFRNMRKWSLIGGVLLSLLALAPTIYWNSSHEWATFRHVGSTVGGGAQGGNFFSFLGAQIGLVSPIFFYSFNFKFFLSMAYAI